MLSALCRTCQVRGSLRRDLIWTCDSEVTLPNGGRLDLAIRAVDEDKRPGGAAFQIENKVEAPLTVRQMTKYCRSPAGRYLVALTKHPPETGLKWLREHDC